MRSAMAPRPDATMGGETGLPGQPPRDPRRADSCAMKNPFRNLDEIRRDLDDIAIQVTHAQFFGTSSVAGWEPVINAFRCGDRFVICVELAGVDQATMEVSAEPRRLAIRGVRPLPEPPCDEAPAVQVLALEINHGRFERILELPADIDPDGVTAEHRNGLLWIKLPLRPPA
jgi:HSP20 family protein